MSRPCPSHMAVAKSPVFTIAERPVFHTAIAISSVMAASSFLITSTRMGSNARAMVSPSVSYKSRFMLRQACPELVKGWRHSTKSVLRPKVYFLINLSEREGTTDRGQLHDVLHTTRL